MSYTLSFLVTSLIILSACTKTTLTQLPPSDMASKESVSMTAYPHPANWASPLNHGKTYATLSDKSSCMTCHDAVVDRGTAPKCQRCHEAYPHVSDNWMIDPTQPGHHASLAKTYAGKCLNCHNNYTRNMPNYGDAGGCLMCHSGNINIGWGQ